MDNPFFRGSHLRKCGPLFYTFALVGGLIGTATRVANGLMSNKIAPVLFDITSINQAIEISLSGQYGAETYFLSIYRSGYVALYILVIHPYTPNNGYSVARYIGSPAQDMKIYVSSQKVYIDVRSISKITITPIGLYNYISEAKVVNTEDIDVSGMTLVQPTSMN